jgi:hypothetical protein
MRHFHLKNTLLTLLAGAAIGLGAMSAPAQAADSAKPAVRSMPAAASTPSTTRAEEKAQMKAAAEQYKEAKRACAKLSGASKRACRKDARAQHRAAVAAGAATSAVPALQTQSSSVNATGVAPSTIGSDPTPARSSTTGR